MLDNYENVLSQCRDAVGTICLGALKGTPSPSNLGTPRFQNASLQKWDKLPSTPFLSLPQHTELSQNCAAGAADGPPKQHVAAHH